MFRIDQEKGTLPLKKGNNGTERLARVRESEQCSVPIPVPFRALSVPNFCTACGADGHRASQCKWGHA
jgi:hypothetical protein